ncbi:hypothetical protein BKA57DRAFT_457257 [Linnemannia elongata]|nr:hypothetical protein BGZ89_007682 [Linnemannia elongata]KAH7051452.1 hypothetical protein BKA57DRAFT_457257 [Linnemannia elongata]
MNAAPSSPLNGSPMPPHYLNDDTFQEQEPQDEQATVFSIETYAEHWTEEQSFSVATLAACAISALESSQGVETLPWKHPFLRSLFKQLGINSRAEQEMFLSLQETLSYQDCNLQVLAEPLLPAMYRRQPSRSRSQSPASPRQNSTASSPVSSPPLSPTRRRRSVHHQLQYGQPKSSAWSSPHQKFMDPLQPVAEEDSPEIDIRLEVINDLLYIGLGFDPSTRSRTKTPTPPLPSPIPQSSSQQSLSSSLSQDLVGFSTDMPPGYTEHDDLYPFEATDIWKEDEKSTAGALAPPIEISPPPRLPPRQPLNQHQGERPPELPPRAPSISTTISSLSSSSSSSSSSSKLSGRVEPLEYDARARAIIFKMCNYLYLSYESFVHIEKQIAQHLYFYQQELIEAEREELEEERRLQEEIEQQQRLQNQGQGTGARFGAFFSNLRGNRTSVSQPTPVNPHGVAMQTQAKTSMQELEKKKKTWKYVATGLSIAAGATVIGLTGGLAAPLVAVGAGVLLGSGAAVLGTTAGIAVMASLFGLAGGGLAGYKMHRRTKDLKVLSFTPIVKDPTLPQIPSLHLDIVISGYLFDESEVIDAWQGTAENALDGNDVFHLTFEPAELVTLGNAFKVFLATEAVRMVSTQVISQTVFAALASALVLPFGLMRAGDLIDNPWVVAMDRARKSGYVLADILMERVQGHRPTTLIGYSTGAVVIWECLLELAKRKEHGLINSVVLLGAPIKTDMAEKWKEASSVVSHRFINGYSRKDVVLASIYRLHALGLDVAGLQPVEAVSRIENVDLTDIVGGHLEYRENLNMIISLLGTL